MLFTPVTKTKRKPLLFLCNQVS